MYTHVFYSNLDACAIQMTQLLHGPSAYEKSLLKTLHDGEGPESAPERRIITKLTGMSQTTNMSPRINTHDSIDQINQLKFSIKSINRNYIAITGATQTTNMSPRFKTSKHSCFNQSNQSIGILLP